MGTEMKGAEAFTPILTLYSLVLQAFLSGALWPALQTYIDICASAEEPQTHKLKWTCDERVLGCGSS